MKQLPALALLVSASMPSLISGQAYAQTLVGKITNQHGKSIAGAQVLVEGTEFKTVTNNNGDFSFSDLPAEVSEVHISAPGYAHLHQKIDQSKTGNVFQFVLQPSPIEVIDVVSTPLHLSAMESSMPVSVLAGESLRQQQSSTLGDTLEKVVGVHTSFHANVASTPIIRGLSGPRVMITQNGLDVGDVSRVGPDHSVASESSTAEQI